MAKKFDPEEHNKRIDNQKVLTRGVALKSGEWAEIEKLAWELDTTTHAIAAYAIRYFMKAYSEGKIKPKTKQSLPDL
jgi:hypothetical protein